MSKNEESGGQAFGLIFLLAMIFGGLGAGAGYGLGRAHQEIETLEVRKTLETYRVQESDKERAARARGIVELGRFRRRVITNQAYVDLLRTLDSVTKKIQATEKAMDNPKEGHDE